MNPETTRKRLLSAKTRQEDLADKGRPWYMGYNNKTYVPPSSPLTSIARYGLRGSKGIRDRMRTEKDVDLEGWTQVADHESVPPPAHPPISTSIKDFDHYFRSTKPWKTRVSDDLVRMVERDHEEKRVLERAIRDKDQRNREHYRDAKVDILIEKEKRARTLKMKHDRFRGCDDDAETGRFLSIGKQETGYYGSLTAFVRAEVRTNYGAAEIQRAKKDMETAKQWRLLKYFTRLNRSGVKSAIADLMDLAASLRTGACHNPSPYNITRAQFVEGIMLRMQNGCAKKPSHNETTVGISRAANQLYTYLDCRRNYKEKVDYVVVCLKMRCLIRDFEEPLAKLVHLFKLYTELYERHVTSESIAAVLRLVCNTRMERDRMLSLYTYALKPILFNICSQPAAVCSTEDFLDAAPLPLELIKEALAQCPQVCEEFRRLLDQRLAEASAGRADEDADVFNYKYRNQGVNVTSIATLELGKTLNLTRKKMADVEAEEAERLAELERLGSGYVGSP